MVRARQHAAGRRHARRQSGLGGLSRSCGILEQVVDRIHPEAVHAAVEPEAQHVQHGILHRGVAPVQVGLLRQDRRGSSTGRSPGPASRRCRRTRSASCSAGRHPAPGRARCTSRASGRRARCGSRRTRDACPRCGSARSPASRAGRGHAPRRPARRNRPACRRRDRPRSGRRRRSRNPPSARDRTARSRPRRRRASTRWSSRAAMPRRSPMPSPSLSWKERGQTW